MCPMWLANRRLAPFALINYNVDVLLVEVDNVDDFKREFDIFVGELREGSTSQFYGILME